MLRIVAIRQVQSASIRMKPVITDVSTSMAANLGLGIAHIVAYSFEEG